MSLREIIDDAKRKFGIDVEIENTGFYNLDNVLAIFLPPQFKNGKLTTDLYLSNELMGDRKKLEETIEHEFGHLKFDIKHPRLSKILRKLSYIPNLLSILPKKYGIPLNLGLATGGTAALTYLNNNLGLSYISLLLTMYSASKVQEILADREAKLVGYKK